MKAKILMLLLLMCFLSFSQPKNLEGDNYPVPVNYEINLCSDIIVGTKFFTPIIAPVFNFELFDDNHNYSIIGRTGLYITLDGKRRNNIFSIQTGPVFKINKKVSVGSFPINLQAEYPREEKAYYLPNGQVYYKEDPWYTGYSNPLSFFVRIDVNSIVKTGFFSKSQLYFEGNYYTYQQLGAFRITYTQKLLTLHKKT